MDFQMLVLDGTEATRTLKNLGFTVPVVAITDDMSRTEALEAGIT